MAPTTLFALLAVVSMCQENFKSFVNITPRSFSSVVIYVVHFAIRHHMTFKIWVDPTIVDHLALCCVEAKLPLVGPAV